MEYVNIYGAIGVCIEAEIAVVMRGFLSFLCWRRRRWLVVWFLVSFLVSTHNTKVNREQKKNKKQKPKIMEPTNNHPIIFVDAGSGFTRLFAYYITEENKVRRVRSEIPKRLPPIISALNQTHPLTHDEFIDQLLLEIQVVEKLLEQENVVVVNAAAPAVIVGATAGLRNALVDGTVKEEDVNKLQIRLKERIPRSSFLVVGGEEEARHELTSVQYCFAAAYPEEAGQAGMCSGGGMSCQLAIPAGDGREDGREDATREDATRDAIPLCVSLPYCLKTANKACEKASKIGPGADALLGCVDNFCQQISDVSAATRGKILGHHEALVSEEKKNKDDSYMYNQPRPFAAIEMLGNYLSPHVGNEIMNLDQARGRLLGFVAGWKEAVRQTTPMGREEWDWRAYATVLTAYEGLAMLEMLPCGSTICFSNGFAVEKGTKELIKPSWSLGVYIDMLREQDVIHT